MNNSVHEEALGQRKKKKNRTQEPNSLYKTYHSLTIELNQCILLPETLSGIWLTKSF